MLPLLPLPLMCSESHLKVVVVVVVQTPVVVVDGALATTVVRDEEIVVLGFHSRGFISKLYCNFLLHTAYERCYLFRPGCA